MIVDRPTAFTADVELAFVKEFARSPLDIVSVALRALVGTPQADEVGTAVNIQQYYECNHELKIKCIAQCEAINGTAEGLPSKEQFAYEILQFARNEKNRMNSNAADKEFALRCYRLYAEVANMIEKPGTTNNIQINNRNTVNKVMIIPPEESLEEWSAKTQKQQTKLIDVAATSAAELRERNSSAS